MIRVAIADDQKLVREGIKSIISEEATIQTVAEAADGKELFRILDTTDIDIVLMDFLMPDMDGLETIKFITEHYPTVRVLILSLTEDFRQIQEIIQAGAVGFILKSTGKQDLIHAIKAIYQGGNFISTDIAISLLDKMPPQGSARVYHTAGSLPDTEVTLSEREMEVLTLIAEGFTNAEIGERLFLSKRTVETHRQHLLEKTCTTNTASLIKYAVSHGLIKKI